MAVGQQKPEAQWTADERKVANLNQRLKRLIMSVLPDDQMNSMINCLTAKSTWDDLILYHEGPSDVKESRVMDLKTFKIVLMMKRIQEAVMSTLMIRGSIPRKSSLAKSKRFFKKGTQRFSSAKETDQTECHKCGKKGHFARDCWSKISVPLYQSPFQSKLLLSSKNKPELRQTNDFEAKYHKVKAKLALLSSSASTLSSSLGKNKGLIAETYDWDDEEVSSDENEITEDFYEKADESSVYSTPLLSLKKLDGAEPVSRPKTIKSILKSKSTFKAETLKGITINEPSSTPARGKSSSASKTNSAPGGKLKNVKMKDDPSLAIVMKELNELKLQISKKKSSYSKNKNAQQVPPNALQNRYKTQFKMNCDLCGQNNHLFENCYEVLFFKKCKRTNHKTSDHAEFMSSMNANQHHTGQGESSSRSRPSRPSVSFPSYTHCGYNDHHSNDCLYYPTCEICGSYDHDTRDHNDIEWFRKRETLQAKNVQSFKANKNDSSSALRSKTPTKRSLNSSFPNRRYSHDANPTFFRNGGIWHCIIHKPYARLDSEEKYFTYLSVAKKESLVDKVAMFSAETKDIATAGCCANIL
ncbi:retrovirus-related pol polyprotein from transposon TNT 1-94 [Tanacetum coccineum]